MNGYAHSPHVYQFGCVREVLPVLDERATLQFCHGLSQLLLDVHDDRTVPRHRLLNGLARYQQKTDAFFAGLNSNLIATIEEHERVIPGIVLRVRVWVDWRFGQNRARIRCIPDFGPVRDSSKHEPASESL